MEFRLLAPSESTQMRPFFESVFTDSEGPEEGALVGHLVETMIADTDPADLRVFVAIDEGEIRGGILLSRLTCEDAIEAFLLAPVAVHQDHQGRGIGQALISHGLRQLRSDGTGLVVTYGDPAFYSKVGFRPISPERIRPPRTLSQPHGWLGQSLTDEPVAEISGRFGCVAALDDPAYW